MRSAIIDSCIRVIDNGRASHRMRVCSSSIIQFGKCIYIYIYLSICKEHKDPSLFILILIFSCDLQLFFVFTLSNTSNHKDQLKVRHFFILVSEECVLD